MISPSSSAACSVTIVGYGVYSGLIGHIDKKSPMQLLNEGAGGHSMVWDAI